MTGRMVQCAVFASPNTSWSNFPFLLLACCKGQTAPLLLLCLPVLHNAHIPPHFTPPYTVPTLISITACAPRAAAGTCRQR
jgi:hypothetical protein